MPESSVGGTDSKKERTDGRRRDQEKRRSETRRTGEKKRVETKPQTAEHTQRHKSPEDAERAKRLRENKLTFTDAKKIAEKVRLIQDEKAVEVDQARLRHFRKLLGESGVYSRDAIRKMDPEEIITESQRLLKYSQVIAVTEADLKNFPEENRDIALEVVNRQIEESRYGEELTVEKIKKGELLKVVEEETRERDWRIDAVEVPRPAAVLETPSPLEAVVRDSKGNTIVESYPHLENVDDSNKVQEILSAQGVEVKVPEKWEKMNRVRRKAWEDKHGIVNTVEFPAAPREQVLFTDEKAGTRVVQVPDKLYMVGVSKVDKAVVEDLLSRSGIVGDFGLPDDFDLRRVEERKALLRERGIEIIPVLAGGGTKWPDRTIGGVAGNLDADFDTVVDRLAELVRDEAALGAAGFAAAGFNQDGSELALRFSQWVSVGKTEWLGELVNSAAFGGGAGYGGLLGLDRRIALQKQLPVLMADILRAGSVNSNYWLLSESAKAIEKEELRALGDPTISAALDSVLNIGQRQNVKSAERSVYNFYANLVKSLRETEVGKQKLNALFSEIDAQSESLRDAMRTMGYSLDDVRNRIHQKAFDEMEGKSPRERALLEWKTEKNIRDMEEQKASEREKGVPLDWKDSMRNVLNILRDAEAANAPASEISNVIQTIGTIRARIPAEGSSVLETKEAKELASKLRSDLEEITKAVQAVYVLRANMFGTAQNPEQIKQLFQSDVWSDKTWRMYFSRFYEDHLGRKYEYVDVAGVTKEFNIQDVAMKVLFQRMREERMTMNRIEDMTLGPLNSASADPVEQDLITRMHTKGYNLSEWGTGKATIDFDHMQEVIDDWYRETTFLGAHGLTADGKREYLDMRKDDLIEKIKNELNTVGVVADRIDEYEKAGILRQVVNNGYYLSWTWGALSDYDLIRIYDRNNMWHDGKRMRPKFARIVNNRNSDVWGGRLVDHFTEFLYQENRGRAGKRDRKYDSNYVIMKHMLGRRRGLLDHNRLLTKIVNDNLGNSKFADDLVAGGGNFGAMRDSYAWNMDNREQLSPGRLTVAGTFDKKDIETEYDRSWVRGAAIAELIDDGSITLENIKWSEVFSTEQGNISKFNMGDWWGDRETTWKYFGPEALQKYLQTPNTKMFIELNSVSAFYSKRENRIQTWMKMITPAHFELGSHWKDWWDMPYGMSHSEKEDTLRFLVNSNRIAKEDQMSMYYSHLRWGPIPGMLAVRRLRQWAEGSDVAIREAGKASIASPFLFLWELIKGSFTQAQMQLAGR